MNDVEVAWLAGLLEGEGCFYLGWRSRPDGSKWPSVQIICEMTDEDVVTRVHEITGVGKLRKTNKLGPNGEPWKPQWSWRVAVRKDAVALLRQLRPHMGARRGAKIDEMLAAVEGTVWRQGFGGHGTRGQYAKGCRCAPCTSANTVYYRTYRKRVAARVHHSPPPPPLLDPLSEPLLDDDPPPEE